MATPAGQPAVGETITVTIDRPAHGGEFIAVHDGCVVFVRGVLVGETVRARVTAVKKRFLSADVEEILSPSEHRVDNRCAAAAQGAGCCDWGYMDLQAEHDTTLAVVRDCLRRIGHLHNIPDVTYSELAPHQGWRTRVRLGVDAHGAAGMKAANSTTVIGGVPCAQTHPAVAEALATHGPYSPGMNVVGAVDSDDRVSLVQVSPPARGRRATSTRAHITGPTTLRQRVAGSEFTLAPTDFWQGHVAAPEDYCARIVEWLHPALDEAPTGQPLIAWDLYGGVGVFAAALARAIEARGGEDACVHLVDVATGERSPHPLVRSHTGDVAGVIPQLPAPSVVVLDPPRKGAGRTVVDAVAKAAPAAVVHVGCDPATLARDLGYWEANGYQLTRLEVVNAFPGTHHCETFALLVRAT